MSGEPLLSAWPEANQRYLMAALAVVRDALERHAARSAGRPEPQGDTCRERLREAAEALPAPAALDMLSAIFGLTPFERDVVLLCAGPELDAGFAALLAEVQGEDRSAPSFSLALAALPGAHWSALSPAAPLRHWRLVEPAAGGLLTTAGLRIDERILCFLTGIMACDERLAGLVEPLPEARLPELSELPESQRVVARRLVEIWAHSGDGEPPPLVQLCGVDPAGMRAIVGVACAELGLQAWQLDAADIPATAAERNSLLRLWEREAVLTGGALLVECSDRDPADRQRPLLSLVERLQGRLVVACREPLATRRLDCLRLDVTRPGSGEQLELWRSELGEVWQQLDGQVAAVVSQFRLTVQGIRAAGAEVRAAAAATGDGIDGNGWLLWEACRAQARPRLDDLARRITPMAGWDDLILPEAQCLALRDVCSHVRRRALVYEQWGFAETSSRGLGISALFTGDSGTGKTLAAEVLANELRLDLYRIDLSQVVSKYIGETEKNLRRIFEAAEDGGAILLFDEADALFGKRSEIKDSHDRYANIEVSYLLQRMEAYHGLAILTTNMRKALDKAFLRRLRFVIQFPFPDEAQRARIWQRVFPAQTPTEDLDLGRLARLTLTGGNIRNVALNAAFLAAEASTPVRPEHVLHAARNEYAKLDKPLTETELRRLL